MTGEDAPLPLTDALGADALGADALGADALGIALSAEERAVARAAFGRALGIAEPQGGALFDVEPSHHARLLAAAA